MLERKKIAIFIDYSIRVPNFKESYESFKKLLFQDNSHINLKNEDPTDIRYFWAFEMDNTEIEKFYISQDASKIKDSEIRSFQPYFFNENHLQRFLEEYSYNIYADCDITSAKDINYINVCQRSLFDIVLIDRYESTRKISNTFFFLSKSKIFPRNLIFLGSKDQINKENYLDIWNPIENSHQKNSDDSTIFLDWLIDLETKYKEVKQ